MRLVHDPSRVLLAAGVLGPPVFVIAVLLGGWMTPGYSHLRHAVSELTERGAPHAALVGTLFLASALLETAFGAGVLHRSNGADRKLYWTGVCLVAYGVIAALLATVFPMDPIGSQATFAGIMHLVLVAVSAAALIAAILLSGRALANEWVLKGHFGTYSHLTVLLMFAGGLATPVLIAAGVPLLGLAERVTQIAYLQWLFTFAVISLRGTPERAAEKP